MSSINRSRSNFPSYVFCHLFVFEVGRMFATDLFLWKLESCNGSIAAVLGLLSKLDGALSIWDQKGY